MKRYMPIVLDTLKETFDKVALLVQFGIKIMFDLEINFVGNADSNYRNEPASRANVLRS